MLHSEFYSLDMDGVDVVLGYPWMQSVGTININAENKFLKLWYKKNKFTLQDMDLVPQKQTEKAHDEAFAREPIEVYETSNDERVVESQEATLESHENNYEVGNIQEEEYEDSHDSEESHVMK